MLVEISVVNHFEIALMLFLTYVFVAGLDGWPRMDSSRFMSISSKMEDSPWKPHNGPGQVHWCVFTM